nr:nanos2 protein [Cladonema pacificum]
MALSEILLQNLMPRNILENDEEADAWSLGGSSGTSSQSEEIPTECRDASDFRRFQDYFGLSNLLNNVKISTDNPLLTNTQNDFTFQRFRRFSWDSDGSDSGAVLSPSVEAQSNRYVFEPNCDSSNPMSDNFKQLPLPSTRLSKAMRDHIVSGAYQQQIENRHTEKIIQHPPNSVPASPQKNFHPPPPPPNMAPVNQPPPPNMLKMNGIARPPQVSVQVCVFCRNNGESESVYTSHVLKDSDGRTSCPILRAYTCPICKANGDNSHTIKYCPMNQNSRVTNGSLPLQMPNNPHSQIQSRNNHHFRQGMSNRPPFPTNSFNHGHINKV